MYFLDLKAEGKAVCITEMYAINAMYTMDVIRSNSEEFTTRIIYVVRHDERSGAFNTGVCTSPAKDSRQRGVLNPNKGKLRSTTHPLVYTFQEMWMRSNTIGR